MWNARHAEEACAVLEAGLRGRTPCRNDEAPVGGAADPDPDPVEAQGFVLGRLDLHLAHIARWGAEGHVHGAAAVQGHGAHEVLEVPDGRVANGRQLGPGGDASGPCPSTRDRRGDDGTRDGHAEGVRDRERDQREHHVHDHAARVDEEACADALGPELVVGWSRARGRTLSGHADVAPEGHHRELVDGRSSPELEQGRTEAEGEDVDADPAPAGGEEVPGLVHEDHEADAQGDLQRPEE